MSAARKKGRPKSNGARAPNGELALWRRVRDLGTPQSEAKRKSRVAIGSEPALAEYPLGCLLSRRLISAEQHGAGLFFAWIWGRYTHMRTVPGVTKLDGTHPPLLALPERFAKPEDLRDWYQAMVPLVTGVTRRVCLEYDFPAWFDRTEWSANQAADLLTIQRDLVALGRCIGKLQDRYGIP